MRALVTGAGGFSGRHLQRFLIDQGVEVHTVGSKVTSPNHHLLTQFDDLARLGKIVEYVQPDFVFHLAGVIYAAEQAEYYRVNTVYAAALLQTLEMKGWKDCPVLLVGTSAEYGAITEADLPIAETTRPEPYSHYGISKLAQTGLGLAAARQERPVVVVRPFNIIGPGMPASLAVQSFAQQVVNCLKGPAESVVRVGNLASSRDFLDIGDAVKIYLELVRTPQAYGQIVNVCSGVGVAMSDVLARLIDLVGASIRVEVDPARFKPVDIAVHYGSTTRLSGLLGYTPRLDLDASLRRILEELIKP